MSPSNRSRSSDCQDGGQGTPDSGKLGRQVVTGTIWVFLLQFALQGVNLVRTWILARLLVPEDFGIIGIAVLAIGLLSAFSETGFDKALVQREKLDRDYLDTAWSISLLRGIFLCTVLLLAAPAIARFYATPRAIPIIRIAGLSFLMGGLNNIGIVFLSKNLKFGRSFFYEISIVLSGLLVTIPLAFVLRNEWAIVWGMLAQMATRLVGSYIVDSYRPRFRLDRNKAKRLCRFGFWVFAQTVVIFLSYHGDKVVLPKILTVEALGFYVIAFNIATLPAILIGAVSRVLFPAYCKLRSEPSKLKAYYVMSMRIICFLAIPACGGIFALAEPIAHCLGNKWVPIIPMVRILALATLVRCIGSASGAVFDGIGKPRLSWIVIMVRLLALAVCIYPLTVWTKWSMSGTAMAVLLSCCASYPVIVYSLFRHVGVGLRDWTQVLLTPMLVGAVMMMVVIHISSLLVGWSLPFQLVSCVLLGMATYCGLVLLLHKQLRYPIDADLWLVLEKMGFCRWLKQRGKGNNP